MRHEKKDNGRKPNRLIGETSPYLLQHAYNPVDWYPWSEAALTRARGENKPIFVSIGYSACHWCHVMERECFENDAIAKLMNENFINIKVDREERPDLDSIYQTASQVLTRTGGWPLSAFLMPDLRPFYVGTYFPPEDRFGRPGFPSVLQSLSQTWREDPDRIEQAASQVIDALDIVEKPAEGDDKVPNREIITRSAARLEAAFDQENGGFGDQPKFPNTQNLELFFRTATMTGQSHYKELALFALEQMAKGGIYDQLGGGFHRYSIDAYWLVPHFEKMLYDNALLVPLYLRAYDESKDPFFASIASETLMYVLREMTSPDGAFYSTQDADSEGAEGKFFVWRPEQIRHVLGSDRGKLAMARWGVTSEGSFEGNTTVLHIAESVGSLAETFDASETSIAEALSDARAQLFDAREKRTRPATDDKVLTGWNGLMISAFATAGRTLGEAKFVQAAKRACDFVLSALSNEDGSLRRSYRHRPSHIPGYLEDYAYTVAGLLDTYEATFEQRYLEEALRLQTLLIERFWDEEQGEFFLTPHEGDTVLMRPRAHRDQSVPSATAVAVQNLLRLAPIGRHERFTAIAERTFRVLGSEMERNPWGYASLLSALETYVDGLTEVVIVAEPEDDASSLIRAAQAILDNRVIYSISPEDAAKADAPAAWKGKTTMQGKPAAYVCRAFSCTPPITDPAALKALL